MKKLSIKHRKKISKALKGKKKPPRTPEHIAKLVKNLKPGWNKGMRLPKEWRKKTQVAMFGKKHSIKTKRKMALAHKGSKSHLWKGGLTSINSKIRNSLEYRLWRAAVFERDNWTCRFCGQKGGNLQADHIKSFALYPELRFAIDNGRTLCIKCHRKTFSYLRNQ